MIDRVNELIEQEVPRAIQKAQGRTLSEQEKNEITEKVSAQLAEDEDLGVVFEENQIPLDAWMLHQTEQIYVAAKEKYIPIPRIKVTDSRMEEHVFVDFEPDLEPFNHVPVSNDVIIQSLTDMEDRNRVKGDAIDFEGYNPKKVILAELRKKPEIDYEKCSTLLFKLISAVCDHYEARYGANGMRNIVMMYKRDIAGKLYDQMMQHFYCENGFLQEEIVSVSGYNMEPQYTWTEKVGPYEPFTKKNQSVLFTGIKRGVFSTAKFDSDEGELTLALVLDRDPDVLNWLRPHPMQFNITYNRNRRYEPDFVVETESIIYLVEVKEKNPRRSDILSYGFHQQLMVYIVEEAFDVDIYDIVIFPASFSCSSDRIQRRFVWSVTVGFLMEQRIKYRLNIQRCCHLGNSILYCWDSQNSDPSVFLWNFHSHDRLRKAAP